MKDQIKHIRVNIDGFNCYEVDNKGNVFSLNRLVKSNNSYRNTGERTLKPNVDKNGYFYVILQQEGRKKTIKIHRLVAQAFITNSNNLPQVNHIDGNKQNNCVSNLEWCTSKENVDHSYNTGLKVTKLTKSQVSEIKEMIGKVPQKEIAKIYNVHNSTISNINKNKTHHDTTN